MFKDPKTIALMYKNLEKKQQICRDKLTMVVKQNKQVNLVHFFEDRGKSFQLKKLVDNENLTEERKLLQQNIDERT